MKKLFILTSAIIIVVASYYWMHPLGEKVHVRGHVVNVAVAVTESQKQKGLGDRDSLPANAGMLFVYQNKDRYGFWMKGMRFPLDFIWIADNSVADISQNIPAPKSGEAPVTLSPKVPVNKVLEVNAGTISRFGIKIGDTIQFSD